MNSVNSVVPTQMITPIKSLPLKTSSQQEADIDDPLIQGVLKEFEDDFIDTSSHAQEPSRQDYAPQQMQPQQPVMQQQQQLQQLQQQVYQQPQQIATQHHQNLNYNKEDSKKLLDINIAKKAALITLVLFALQYTNISSVLVHRLPESVASYISGKELLFNLFIVFIVVYAVFYLELL